MRLLCLFLLTPSLAVAAGFGVAPTVPVDAADRTPGVVVAVHGSTYVLQIGDEPAVAAGTVLQVYRRLPSPRGAAPYRSAELWWDVGRLSVSSIADGVAIATQVAGPRIALPTGLDESGAPSDRVQVGDLVRTTGAVAVRPLRSRVVFDAAALFAPEGTAPSETGRAHLARWAAGVKRIEGPVEVRVRTRLRELGVVAPDLSRSVSATRDAPEGPVAGDPVTPVMDLYSPSAAPAELPPARAVHVVEARHDAEPETFQYLDPISLAHKRAEAVADVIAAAVGLDREAVLVTVVALPQVAAHEDAPGHDRGGDQVWILAGDLEWVTPPPVRKRVEPRESPKSEEDASREDRGAFERAPPKDVG
jgi:hypothetical protein